MATNNFIFSLVQENHKIYSKLLQYQMCKRVLAILSRMNTVQYVSNVTHSQVLCWRLWG